MESVVRSSQLVLFAALVVKATSRIPCAAHQNVDGVGGGTNQPNVITQSVTWSSAKKGHKPTSTIEGECPTDEILLESSSSPKTMKFVSGSARYGRSEYADAEENLDVKIKRLMQLLDYVQKREEKCEWGTCSRPRKTWKKNHWRRRDDFEDDDYRDGDGFDYASAEEEEVQQVRRPKRPRYQNLFDEDVEEEPKRVKMVPKMDWLVLKKCPKRYPKRWFSDELDRQRDSPETEPARDILYIPPSEPKEKRRRRIVNDSAR